MSLLGRPVSLCSTREGGRKLAVKHWNENARDSIGLVESLSLV